jgi:hypothetical protein
MSSNTKRVKPIIDRQADEAQVIGEKVETINEAPSIAPPGFYLMIVFDFVRGDGSKGTDRAFLHGVPDIRVRAQLEGIEKMIVDQSQGQIIRALITNWKSLEG